MLKQENAIVLLEKIAAAKDHFKEFWTLNHPIHTYGDENYYVQEALWTCD